MYQMYHQSSHVPIACKSEIDIDIDAMMGKHMVVYHAEIHSLSNRYLSPSGFALYALFRPS